MRLAIGSVRRARLSRVRPASAGPTVEAIGGAVLRVSGATALARHLRRKKLTILTYHSIASEPRDRRTCLWLAHMRIDKSQLERHLRYVARNYTPITLSNYVRWRRGEEPLPPNPCVLTFDDGYEDVYLHAVPILKNLNLTANFFVIGSTLVPSRGSWLHSLYELLDSVPVPLASAAFSAATGVTDLEAVDKGGLRQELRRYFGRLGQDERSQVLDAVRTRLSDHQVAPTEFMSSDQIRELDSSGFEIGAHSMSHQALTSLPDDQLAEEVCESRLAVAGSTAGPPTTFCYPFGGLAEQDTRTAAAVRACGFDCAVTTLEGFNDARTDLYALRRIDVSGNVGLSVLAWRLAGSRALRWKLRATVPRLLGTTDVGRDPRTTGRC